MSDQIKHECGIAFIRLRKPLEYYVEKYGTAFWGLNKLFLLMQKQINRGQDGVGMATIKLDPPPGTRYISRQRCNEPDPVRKMFEHIYGRINNGITDKSKFNDAQWLKSNLPFTGEVLIGHLRYGTHGGNSLEQCHPFLKQNNWITRNLLLAGNFNMTNVPELFQHLIDLGQHPKEVADTVTLLEKLGHFQDSAVQKLFDSYKANNIPNTEITAKIIENLDVADILRQSTKKLDGGYALVGAMGHGDAFVLRDPSGIRPAFYYVDDEIICCASERPAIQTAINAPFRDVHEVPPGAALIVKKDGSFSIKQIIEPAQTPTPCSFERIYFSRGNDRAIYTERKKLGELLAESTLQKVHYNFKNTVFSFIPNTAETAYLGLIQGVEQACNRIKTEKLTELLKQPNTTNLEHEINEIVKVRPRFEKLISKDVKMRTFIAEDSSRDELVSHVYDVTYGIINNHKDTVVLIDDSIVRGTTLKMSILRMTNRLLPKKIIVLSSAPQIRYPDCYGIDMSKLKEFVAFQAMIQLLKEKDLQHKIDEAYQKCKASLDLPLNEIVNEIQPLYDLLDYEEVSQKIGKMITPPDFDIEVDIIYQTIEGLHIACPNNHGDWYFTGNYPTPGGNRVANRAFVYFYEGLDKRAY